MRGNPKEIFYYSTDKNEIEKNDFSSLVYYDSQLDTDYSENINLCTDYKNFSLSKFNNFSCRYDLFLEKLKKYEKVTKTLENDINFISTKNCLASLATIISSQKGCEFNLCYFDGSIYLSQDFCCYDQKIVNIYKHNKDSTNTMLSKNSICGYVLEKLLTTETLNNNKEVKKKQQLSKRVKL
ncbi:uncharacterized protein ASCRUDRAFT_140174 [Ascoidea rubescens DSM 1968]|uniref:RAI1-like domain-containing protein n=1 Tax=Ascoidea rubescens DSM 1968 TaxID=1344418 RepID=A0A1D2VKA4_9ASCO|nr:hypothetical protein ASCRUDRAFT_140174 [Ascoidea rubescens DSM 1968]ODV62029.1 hypothetical protein ASCRUDRAFT_140174 [Ascoidea rubescens DSM 1968]